MARFEMHRSAAVTGESSFESLLNDPTARLLKADEEHQLLEELATTRLAILAWAAAVRPRLKDGSLPAAAEETDISQLSRAIRSGEEATGPEDAAIRDQAQRYEEIRARLALANVRLVAHSARRYRDRGIAFSDLLQEGFCGLLAAIDRFDVSTGNRLATYAVWWIRQSLQRAVAAGAYPVRLNPRHLRLLAAGQGVPFRDRTLQDIQNQSPQSRQMYQQLISATRPTVSLDAFASEDDAACLIDILEAPSEDDFSASEPLENVEAMLRSLKPREQLVLQLRYGLDGKPRHSLSQVSQLLDVSKERIRQIQERAIQKLQEQHRRPESVSPSPH
jgi:RNA polymerase primary sigma factor